MKNYIYLVVIVGSDHNAKTAVIAGDKELKGLSLSKVLALGWVPIRETPMGGGESACSLVVLEHDGKGPVKAVVSEPKAEAKVESKPEPKVEPKPEPKAEVKAKPVTPPKAAPKKEPATAGAAKPEPKPSDSDISFDFLADEP